MDLGLQHIVTGGAVQGLAQDLQDRSGVEVEDPPRGKLDRPAALILAAGGPDLRIAERAPRQCAGS